MIYQQEREQRHQVPDGILEHFHGEQFVRRVQQADGVIQEHRAQHHRAAQIEQAAHAGKPRQQGDHEQQDGVEQDLPACVGDSVDDRQHRYQRAGIVIAAEYGQCPEMRRRPYEDDQEQQQRVADRRYC